MNMRTAGTMLLKSVLVIVFSLGVLGSLSDVVRAEELVLQEVEGTDAGTITRSTVIADVNVGDVVVESRDGGVNGSFSIISKLGQQNDIVYGLMVTDTENTLVDLQYLGKIDSVREGEIRSLPFSYTYPAYLRGSITLTVYAETLGGVPLGRQVIETKDLGEKSGTLLSCVAGDKTGIFSCLSPVDGFLNISYRKESFFGAEAGVDKVAVSAGQSVSVQPKLSAGEYVAVIRGMEGELATRVVRIPGGAGTIKNVLLYQDPGNGSVVASVALSRPERGSRVQLTLKNGQASCGEATGEVVGMVAEVTLTTTCQFGTVTVMLLDASGKTVQSVSQEFSLEKVGSENVSSEEAPAGEKVIDMKAASSWNIGTIFLAILGIIVLVAAVVFRARILVRRGSVIKVGLFFLVSMGFMGFGYHAQALSLYTETLGPAGCGPCEIEFFATTVISSDKATYAPGDTLTLTASHGISFDVGAIDSAPAARPEITIGYLPGTFDVDLLSASSPPAYATRRFVKADLPLNTPSYTLTYAIPANMGAGNHFISQKVVLTGLTSVSMPSRVAIGRVNFTVSAPTPTATLSILPGGSQNYGTTITWTLSSTNAQSCEVVESPGNNAIINRAENITNTSMQSSTTGVGTWTYTTRCWSGPNGTGSVSAIDSDSITIVAPVPTATISASRVAFENQSFWYKAVFFLTGRDHVAQAGVGATITVGETATLNWNSTNASTCTISGPTIAPPINTFGGAGSRALVGLAVGTHTFTISCSGAGGNASDSTVVVVDAIPFPTGLTATPGACATGTIALSWNPVAGATSYELRDGASVIYTGLATSYSHTGLAANTAHSYTVRANKGANSSTFSAPIVNANSPAGACGGPVPVTPIGLTATPAACGTGTINISWNAVAGATGYTLRDNGGVIANPVGTAYSHSGLVAGSGHSYTVQANNANGSSAQSGAVAASAPAVCPVGTPGIPTNLAAAAGACDSNTITVSWNAAAGATGYTLRDNGAVIYNNGPSTSFTHSGLVANSNHSYTIQATNASGSSAQSAAVNRAAPATCVAATYTITATAGAGGWISPSGVVSVVSGGGRTFDMGAGYPNIINRVLVDGVDIGAPSTYTFSNVAANHTISVSFVAGTVNGITKAQGCTIFAGNSTCNGLVSWETFGAVQPVEVTVSGTPWSSNFIAATNQVVAIDRGTHTVTLRDQGSIFETADMTAICFGALLWSQGICQASGGTISAAPVTCTIPLGESTCNTNLTWSSTNLINPRVYNFQTGVVYSNAANGNNQTFPVSFGLNSIYLEDNAGTRAGVNVTASCFNSGVWNNVTKVCDPGNPAATITTTACTIPNGASTCNSRISWTSSALTAPLSVRQDGVEFDTRAIVLPGANLLRPVTHTAAGGTTFTAVHNGNTLDTKVRGGTCAAVPAGLNWDGAKCAVVCVPNNTCADHAAEVSNTCIGTDFAIANNGCGSALACPGTRVCNFNWKEVAP